MNARGRSRCTAAVDRSDPPMRATHVERRETEEVEVQDSNVRELASGEQGKSIANPSAGENIGAGARVAQEEAEVADADRIDRVDKRRDQTSRKARYSSGHKKTPLKLGYGESLSDKISELAPMHVPDIKRRIQGCNENERGVDRENSTESGSDSLDSEIGKENVPESASLSRSDVVRVLSPTKTSTEILLKPHGQKQIRASSTGVGGFGDLSAEKLAGLLPISVIQAAFVKHIEIRESQGKKQTTSIEGDAFTDVVSTFDAQKHSSCETGADDVFRNLLF